MEDKIKQTITLLKIEINRNTIEVEGFSTLFQVFNISTINKIPKNIKEQAY